MQAEKQVRLIALYFPQFHAIPENDAWWGKGFTDWVNVRRGAPQFRGHYQPRGPLGGRYYDQSHKEILEWQIDLARRHGVSGFCHYHYWFDGKQLLETPTNIMLESPELDFPFCLAWANETWSRRWDGLDWAVLFNTDGGAKSLAGAIDPLVHGAADKVKEWPEKDLFEK